MKKIVSLYIAMLIFAACIVPMQISAAAGDELLTNGGFENVTSGAPDGVTANGGWGGSYVSLVTETYSGERAVKLTANGADRAYIDFNPSNLFYGTTYTLSFMYKGTVGEGDGLSVMVQMAADSEKNDSMARSYYAPGVYTAEDWTKFSYTFKLYEGSALIVRPILRSATGTVYIDDVSLVTSDAPVARVKTDRVFYYSDYEKEGKAEVTLSPHYSGLGYTADVSFKDRTKTYDKVEGAEFENGKISYSFPMSLLSVKEKEYKVEVTVRDSDGNSVYTVSERIYKFDRPSCISKDLVYTDINGKVVNPTFIYTIGEEDWATAIKNGINVIQYVAPSGHTTEDVLADLDYIYELGGYAAIVTYTGMYPAGNPTYYTRNQNFVNSIKHHPAVFCYMVMDEPFLNNPEAHEDLRNSYIMLRTADPARPTFMCEGFSAYMPEIVKYCDIMAPDIYPGAPQSMATYVADMMKYARECGEERYLMAILQAFFYTGKSPSASELRSMMYQSFMAGANGIGYYLWNPLRPEYGDTYMDEGKFWPMLQAYYQNEHETVNKYYHTHENKRFNKNIENNAFWYDSWWDGDDVYMVVQNRDVNNAATAEVPLAGDDGTVLLSYDMEVISEGDITAVTGKRAGGFTVNLAPAQALLFKITPKEEVAGRLSFEGISEEDSGGWEFNNTDISSALYKDDAYEGDVSIMLTGTANASVSIAVAAEPGKTYKVDFMYKSDAQGAVKAFLTDSAGRYNGGALLPAAEEWTRSSLMLHVGQSLQGILNFKFINTSASATVMLDDITVTEVEHDAQNIILNPSFEEDGVTAEGAHFSWWYQNGGSQMANDFAYSGNTALKIRQRYAAYGYAPINNKGSETPDNSDGFMYRLEGYVRDNSVGAEGATAPAVQIVAYNSVQAPIAGADFSYTLDETTGVDTANEWQKFVININPENIPENTAYVRILLFAGSGWTWYDDISMKGMEARVSVTDENGSVLSKIKAETNATFTARAEQIADKTAKLYLAHYKEVGGDLRLYNIQVATMDEYNTKVSRTISGIDTTKGKHTVRAFLWSGNEIIDTVTITAD